jgi:hypothetical protein
MEKLRRIMKYLARIIICALLVTFFPPPISQAATSPTKVLNAFSSYLKKAELTHTTGMATAKSNYEKTLTMKQAVIASAKNDFKQFNRVKVLKLGDNRNYWGSFNCPASRPDCIYVDKGPKFEVGEFTTIKDAIAEKTDWLDEIELIVSLGLIELQSPNEYRRATSAIKNETLAIENLNRNYASTKQALEESYESALVVEPAILALKRASKNSKDFENAFVTALKFDYNVQGLDELANLPFRYINSLKALDSAVKVTKLSQEADSVASSYTMASASKINKICGNTFTKDAKFREMFSQVASLYEQFVGEKLKA